VNGLGRPRHMTTDERFWEKVERGPADQCWPWTGSRNSSGYGTFATGTTRATIRVVLAHRHAWEMHHFAIPTGYRILHACDNPPCVNPGHLMLGSARANLVDASRKGRLGKRAA
jgi:hypothetical protein